MSSLFFQLKHFALLLLQKQLSLRDSRPRFGKLAPAGFQAAFDAAQLFNSVIASDLPV